MAITLALNVNAQLGAPKTETTDTLIVHSAYYQQSEVDVDKIGLQTLTGNGNTLYYFTESETKIHIAGQTYYKKSPTTKDIYEYHSSWGGHIDYYHYANATVNGKKASIYKVLTRPDCEDDYPIRKYIIDDYEFYVYSLKELRLIIKNN